MWVRIRGDSADSSSVANPLAHQRDRVVESRQSAGMSSLVRTSETAAKCSRRSVWLWASALRLSRSCCSSLVSRPSYVSAWESAISRSVPSVLSCLVQGKTRRSSSSKKLLDAAAPSSSSHDRDDAPTDAVPTPSSSSSLSSRDRLSGAPLVLTRSHTEGSLSKSSTLFGRLASAAARQVRSTVRRCFRLVSLVLAWSLMGCVRIALVLIWRRMRWQPSASVDDTALSGHAHAHATVLPQASNAVRLQVWLAGRDALCVIL